MTPCTNSLLELIMGCPIDKFNENIRLSTLKKVTTGQVPEHLIEFHQNVRLRVKDLLTNNTEALLLNISQVLVNPRAKNYVIKCDCGSFMVDRHWQECSRAESLLNERFFNQSNGTRRFK